MCSDFYSMQFDFVVIFIHVYYVFLFFFKLKPTNRVFGAG